MQNQIARISVKNPMLVAMLSPIFSLIPIFMIQTTRQMPESLHLWSILAYVVLLLTLFVIILYLGSRKLELELYADHVRFGKRHITLEEIRMVETKPFKRYLIIRTQSAPRILSLYVTKTENWEHIIATLKTWSQQTGVPFQM